MPSLLLGLSLRGWFVNEKTRFPASLLIATSALGAFLPLYMSATGTLVDYEETISGSRTISQHPQVWLALYLILTLCCLTPFLRVWRKWPITGA